MITTQIVSLIITAQCNSRCLFCGCWKGDAQSLSIRQMQMVEEFIRLQTIPYVLITGGEPLVHQNFSQIHERISAIAKVILATNGTLLDRLSPKDLNRMTEITISLDTMNAHEYRKMRGIDGFDAVVNGIKRIKQLSPSLPLTLSCLIQRQNVGYLDKFVHFIEQLPVKSLSLIVPSYERCGFGWERLEVSSRPAYLTANEIAKVEQSLSVISKRRASLPFEIKQNDRIFYEYIEYFRMLAGLPYNQSAIVSHACLVPHQMLVIDELGNVRPCFYLSNKFSLDECIADSGRYSQFLRNFNTTIEPCRTCMQFLCNESVRPFRDEKGANDV